MGTLTGSASTSFNDTLTSPDDGVTLRNVASVNGPFQALIDNDKILENKHQFFFLNGAGISQTTVSAFFVDLNASYELALGTLAIGDKVIFNAHWSMACDAGTSQVAARLVIEEDGVDVPCTLEPSDPSATVLKWHSGTYGYAITAEGAARAKLQFKRTGGSDVAYIDDIALTAIVQKAT
jgi:hypothetical protein